MNAEDARRIADKRNNDPDITEYLDTIRECAKAGDYSVAYSFRIHPGDIKALTKLGFVVKVTDFNDSTICW